MRVVYALPVRHLEGLTDGSFVAVGIETTIRYVLELPNVALVPLLVCIATPHVNAQPGIEHTLTATVTDPELNDAIEPMTVPFQMQPGPNTPEGWEVRALMPCAIRFEVMTHGAHVIGLSVDSEMPHDVPIIVSAPPA